ncbi:hypothetical protein OUZ56_032815 [Daphnia magna]|uniref:Secreted protein n=1 Tax=Daphnia magna TaxID=35525 RepID=A0ABR0B9L7_9CRUS|nr:hypothetical protein OUZ56_032815 [Daphnia magna]
MAWIIAYAAFSVVNHLASRSFRFLEILEGNSILAIAPQKPDGVGYRPRCAFRPSFVLVTSLFFFSFRFLPKFASMTTMTPSLFHVFCRKVSMKK